MPVHFTRSSAVVARAALFVAAASAPLFGQVADTTTVPNVPTVAGIAAPAPAVTAAAISAATAAASSEPQKTFFVRSDLAWTGAAIVGSGIVSIFDKRIAHFTQEPSVQGSQSRHNVANDITKVNETTLTEASIVTYGLGRLFRSPMIADVGLHTTESLLLTSAISQIIRGPLGRERPSVSPDNQYKFDAGKGFTQFNNRSFPSLHSATAFAAAASLVGEIKERDPGATWIAGPLLYAAASVPGLTRMYLDQHWASDIFSGAFVGTLIGSRVVSYAHSHKRTKLDKWLLGTTLMPDGHGGLALAYTTAR